MDLVADIGGTHTRCALIDGASEITAIETFLNRDFDGILGVLEHYVARHHDRGRPSRAALGVAGPVTGDSVAMTNLAWRFSQAELADALGLSRLVVVNDFAAVAWALPSLAEDALWRVGGGGAVASEPRVVLGPGSGLGVALLAPTGDGWTVIAGEGGNVSVATTTPAEAAVVDALRDANGYCAVETLVSGPGLARIDAVLRSVTGRETPEMTPAEVSAAADAGDEIAMRARALFFGVLGSFAGDLALTAGARGGVYIAGGIVPRTLEAFAHSAFRKRFVGKGRYRDYLEAIPTFVITAQLPALDGLRALLAAGSRSESISP